MTPKEKAVELVSKMVTGRITYARAKQCALIAVEEVMVAIPPNINPMIYMPAVSYWHQVKTEIFEL